MVREREEKIIGMALSALTRTVIFRVGEPGSDVSRRCSKHVGWFLSPDKLGTEPMAYGGFN